MAFTAFEGIQRLAAGDIVHVNEAARQALARGAGKVVVLADESGEQVDVDPRVAVAEDTPAPKAGRGRPKLGVVPREVTLLPRHWEWLSAQPGGASAALRRLVEDARRTGEPADRARKAQTAVYRVMSVLAGDLAGYEDALRALYAQDDARFDERVSVWPADVRDYVRQLAAAERDARRNA